MESRANLCNVSGPQPSEGLLRQTQSDRMPAPPPTSPNETEPRRPGSENRESGDAGVEPSGESAGQTDRYERLRANDPVSFVPHTPIEKTVPPQPLRIRTGRYGELDEHELLHLLESIEDERARARFRESVYLSVFIWMAIALIALFGPKYIWHAPRLVLPSEVLRARDVTTLNAPRLTAPRLRPAPPVDTRTLEHLRSAEPKLPSPAPAAPPEPRPEPRTETRPQPPSAATPVPNLAPSTAPPNLPVAPPPQPKPVAPTPRPSAAAVPDAPTPQPNFNTGARSPGESIQNAIRGASPGTGAPRGIHNSGRSGTDLGMGPAEILSDTQGVNFNPYLKRILQEIYDQWIPLIPEEARPPLRKSGVTMIRFTILPDGNIGGMNLDDSTHDDALNRAAWGSIIGVGQFPPLPSQFHGPNLELRIHFLVNRDTE